MNKERLLNVAKALREAPDPKQFTMLRFGKPGDTCGTPCCALGHYAIRKDLQKTFSLGRRGDLCRASDSQQHFVGVDDDIVLKHFGINYAESDALFGMRGCGEAKRPEDAAAFIERFVNE